MSHTQTHACLATLATALTLCSAPALADIEVTFLESAPKDRFTFTNTGACDLGPAILSLDLSGSAAGLIFDTSGDGAGVEVFQPYETVAGAEVLEAITPVSDGDAQIALTVSGLAPGQSVGFTIDVDDTLRDSNLGQIRVSDSEIKGATAAVSFADQTSNGVFDATSRATLRAPACTS